MNLSKMITMKIALVVALGATGACTKSEASLNGNTATTANRAENKAAVNAAASPEAVKTEPAKPAEPAEKRSETAALDLSTPTAAYKTAYAARKAKDLPTLKRAMSKDALEFMGILVEPGKTVDDALRQMTETPQAATDESRSEKITGDTATLEYPDENGKWKTMYLVKENGDWKITMPKADTPGAMKKSK